ncbi:MAG: hypothetical protein HY318_15695 [Armatimonadetes bacterium]|nr:hypothetical protein [Armatimonadota bacterium]
MRATLERWPTPRGAEVDIKVVVKAHLGISSRTAQDIAEDFLLMEVGDLLSAGDPCVRAGERLSWEVPILLSNATRGNLGEVGRLLVDAETGDVEFTDKDRREVKVNARALSETAASSASD